MIVKQAVRLVYNDYVKDTLDKYVIDDIDKSYELFNKLRLEKPYIRFKKGLEKISVIIQLTDKNRVIETFSKTQVIKEED